MKTFSIQLAVLCGVVALSLSLLAQPVPVRTLAGYAGGRGTDGPGNTPRFNHPHGLALDVSGNLFVADTDNHTIRKITSDGSVSTIAGETGVSGSNDNNGTNAHFFKPEAVAVDSLGNVYVADSGNHTIRKITSAGEVSTMAGLAGIAGNQNGNETGARFNQPLGIAVDSAGQVYVSDFGNGLIRKITTGGDVSTLATLPGPQGLVLASASLLYVAEYGSSSIVKVTTSGTVSYWAGSTNDFGNANGSGTNASFYHPAAVAVDNVGTVYVADFFNSTVRQITSSSIVSTLAGWPGINGSVDATGTSARFFRPQGIAVDSAFNVYVADTGNSTIRKISSSGVVATFAGSPSGAFADATRGAARFSLPSGIVADPSGTLYLADSQNNVIRKVTPAGSVSTLAGVPGNYGTADGIGTNAQFLAPGSMALDGAGNLFVADTGNSTIRKITAGSVTTFAGLAGNFGYVDGSGTNAEFRQPQGVVVDSAGNVFVADTLNHAIRKISPAGLVSTVAGRGELAGSADGTNSLARFNRPAGLAVDASDNIYVADSLNHTVRRITHVGTNWITGTIAGLAGQAGSIDGTNSASRLCGPVGLAVDAGGNIFVIDSGNQSVRKIAPVGTNWIVTTVAGTSGVAGSLDGLGSEARFQNPSGIAIDAMGYLYVTDTANNTLRVTRAIAPDLRIESSASHSVVLKWSTLDTGFSVETSAALLPASWNPINNQTVIGDDYVATNSIGAGNSFYRLRKPN